VFKTLVKQSTPPGASQLLFLIHMAQNGTDGGNGKIMEDPKFQNLVVQNLPQSFEGWMAHTCTHCMSFFQ